jgi:hypothetical protein
VLGFIAFELDLAIDCCEALSGAHIERRDNEEQTDSEK